jgi:hypothetical protein
MMPPHPLRAKIIADPRCGHHPTFPWIEQATYCAIQQA